MLKTMLGAIGLTAVLLSATTAPAQTMFRPVAVVNDSAITGFDLAQRDRLPQVFRQGGNGRIHGLGDLLAREQRFRGLAVA